MDVTIEHEHDLCQHGEEHSTASAPFSSSVYANNQVRAACLEGSMHIPFILMVFRVHTILWPRNCQRPVSHAVPAGPVTPV
jgi:hypothetical protein